MLIRSDARVIFGIFTFFMLFVAFSNQLQQKKSLRDFVDFHVVMHIKSIPQNKKEHKQWDHVIHRSLPALNKAFKVDQQSGKRSEVYAHKKDHIFLTHAHGETGSYCFHTPSNITFDEFAKRAYSFYKKKGIIVSFHRDYNMKVTSFLNKPVIGYEGQILTLSEYEKYGSKGLAYFDELIAKEDDYKEKNRLKDLKEMQPMFDWHLKMPLVGVMIQSEEDQELPREGTPLSWFFSAWDLAPNKGAGVKVAIVDTGSAGFDLPKNNFSKHPDITNSKNIANFGLNLVSENGLDPIHQLAIVIKKYCSDLDILSIEDGLAKMVINFLKTKNSKEFEEFLTEHGTDISDKPSSVSTDDAKDPDSDDEEVKVTLSEALEEILYGDYGILPNKKQGFFTLIKLKGENVILETLPSPIIKKNINFMATHGTFTQGLITSIAPDAEYFPIKTLKDDGSTTEASFDHALRVSMLVKADILNLSLKSSESYDSSDEDDVLMKQLVDSFDYVVAASGNDGDPRSSAYVGKKEAYPAKFPSVAFDVGGFAFDDYKYTYGAFSQFEPSVGPKFLAPGFNVLSSAINPETGEMCKMFMGGTSVAVPVITGCVTLVLGEFKDEFSRETILTVLYESAMKMNGSNAWANNVSLGMIDIRSALLCLHVLREIKENNIFDIETREDYLVKEIFSIIFTNPNIISSETGIVDMRSNFTEFRNKCSQLKGLKVTGESLFTSGDIPSRSDVVAKIISRLKENRNKLQMSVNRSRQLEITNNDLFSSLSKSPMFKRTMSALNFEIDRDNYWHESIDNNISIGSK